MATAEREKGERLNEVWVRGLEQRRAKGTVVQTARRWLAQPWVSELTGKGTDSGATLKSFLHRGAEEGRERKRSDEWSLGFDRSGRGVVSTRASSAGDRRMQINGQQRSGLIQPRWASDFPTQAQVAA